VDIFTTRRAITGGLGVGGPLVNNGQNIKTRTSLWTTST